ncbi:MAG: cytochrome b N-terminal domain-containing protein [Chloroflexi bacterium]|nr:cytochrome b N-terminal domain-containing protein [Chloroflexota bacterium]MCL5075154.1 cytochrome b N-terminal domain-containing protein [Chloroflexota bacterium]
MQRRSITASILSWLNERYEGLPDVYKYLLKEPIPKQPRWWYLGLGGTVLFFFIVQVITGILLSFYYKPTPEGAYESILFIMGDVRFGWLIRSIHSWSAQLMIISVILHMLRVLVSGAYKRPRELTWVVGVFLFFITLAFGFTGYLLPWDQRAYWATTVGTEMAGSVPLIGTALLRLLRAGSEVSDLTLTRFYGTHMLVLPAVLMGLVALHILLVRLQGVSEPPADFTDAEGERQ